MGNNYFAGLNFPGQYTNDAEFLPEETQVIVG